MSNNIAIPHELIEKLKENRCVAFIGSGLSIGAGLPDWYYLIKQMIEWCDNHNINLPKKKELNKLLKKEKYTELADTLIEFMGIPRYQQFLKEVFRKANLKPTETHKLLPKISFSSVLTTNYDKLIEGAYTKLDEGILPQTFTHMDAPELATTLQSDNFYILKTHGDIDRVDSIVLGSNQYRELLHNNRAYKTHLQNILTSKTLLFLGFSLTDPDLFSILDELSVSFKGNTSPHYALMDSNKLTGIEIERFRRNFNINVIAYKPSDKTHPEVPHFLQEVIDRTPKKFLVNLEKAKQDLENIDSHFKLIADTEGKFTLKEKYPGAIKDKPLKSSFTLRFDSKTKEGKEFKEKLDKFIDSGEKLSIPPEFVDGIELPEPLKKIFSGELITTSMDLKPYSTGIKINTRLTVYSNTGKTVSLNNLELEHKSTGKKLIILNNENQEHPFKFKMEMPTDESKRESNCSFSANLSNVNVKQAYEIKLLLSAIAEGGELVIERSDTGIPIGRTQIRAGTFIEEDYEWLELLEKLTIIQKYSGIQINNPSKISGEQAKAIYEAAYLMEHGKAEVNFSVKCDLDRKGVELLLQDKFSGEIVNSTEQTYIILDYHIQMGSIYCSSKDFEVSDEDKNRIRCELKNKETDRFTVVLQTPKDLPAEAFYLNYVSREEFEKLHKDTKFRQHTLKNIVELLIQSALFQTSELDKSALLEFFKTAKKQKTKYETPLNMIGRCNKEELEETLLPHTEIINESLRNQIFNEIFS